MNLRETFEFLAVEAGEPPPAMADRALAQHRWNRTGKLISAGLVVVAAAVIGFIWPDGGKYGPPPANPPGVPSLPPTRPWTLGTLRLGGYEPQDAPTKGAHVLDPHTGTYRTLPAGAVISPDGRRAAYPRVPVTTRNDPAVPAPKVAVSDQVTLVDLTTGLEQHVPLPWGAADFRWSPDSSTLIGTTTNAITDPETGSPRRVGFYRIRVGDSQATLVPVSQGACDAVESDPFGWWQGEIYATSPGPSPTQCTLTYYGLDGIPHRSLSVPGSVRAVSPDAGLLLVERVSADTSTPNFTRRFWAVDARTGSREGTFLVEGPAPARLRPAPFAWLDDRHLLAWEEAPRQAVSRERLVATDVNGHVTRVLSRWGNEWALQFIPVGP